MTCSARPVHIAAHAGAQFAAFTLLWGLFEAPLQAQITWDFPEPLDVAESAFGNKCPRLVLDADGDPGIFLSDAEGPDVATWGNTIGLAYQIAGQWATGAMFMRSDDGGLTWSASYPIAPDATEDHFMPIPAFDDDGNPFVGLKLGSGNNAQEGVLLSPDGGMTWNPAEPASAAASLRSS
jgi:hypothetical protein